MFNSVVKSFFPWILFFILTGHTQKQLDIAIIVAMVTTVLFEYRELKNGFVLSWGTFIFFVFMIIYVVYLENQWVRQYSWVFSNGALATIAWGSIIIHKPFTIQYAKEQVSKDKWKHPLFLKINYLLTSIWGLIFLISIILHLLQLHYPMFSGISYEIVSYILTIFGIWFTTWFPSWYRERYISKNNENSDE